MVMERIDSDRSLAVGVNICTLGLRGHPPSRSARVQTQNMLPDLLVFGRDLAVKTATVAQDPSEEREPSLDLHEFRLCSLQPGLSCCNTITNPFQVFIPESGIKTAAFWNDCW